MSAENRHVLLILDNVNSHRVNDLLFDVAFYASAVHDFLSEATERWNHPSVQV